MDRYEREQEIQNLIGKPQEDAPPGVEWWIGIDTETLMEQEVPLGHMVRMVPKEFGNKVTIRICHYGICVFAADVTTFALNTMLMELNNGLEQLSRIKETVTEWTEQERHHGLRPSASSMLGQLRSMLGR